MVSVVLWHQHNKITLAKIKSVKTASGKRVQVGSKAYDRALSSGDKPVSGTGKNLTSRDIKNVGGDFNADYQDEVSTTEAKLAANEAGELLPFQQEQANLPSMETPEQTQFAETTAKSNLAAVNEPQTTPGGATVSTPGQQAVLSPYQQGLSAWQASGGAVPQSTGQGRAAASAFTPTSPQTGAVDMAFDQDPILASITSAFAEYMSPPKQKDTLLSQYKSLVKSTGLDDINDELIDTKRIIDGTEDDIRAEVTAASGFATDSQILAMTASRNKAVIQNYNNLLATKQSIEANIDNMMTLSKEDKQMANERFDKQMNLGFKVLEYRDKMQSNAKEGYNNIVNALGYQGLYQSLAGDPYSLALAEKTMGLGAGQLSQLAAQPDLKRSLLQEQIRTERAQQANYYSQVDERSAPESDGMSADTLAYVSAVRNGTLGIDKVPQKIRGEVLAQVQASGSSKMLDLLNEYKSTISGLNLITANLPNKKALINTQRGQLIAEYKQQKQLGTLDLGVERLIDKIIPDPSKPGITSFSNKAQVDAIDNFIKNVGGESQSNGAVVKMLDGKPTEFYLASDGKYYPK